VARIVLPTPLSHQTDKLLHPARHKILVCGRRWYKTTLGIIAAIVGHGPNRERIGALQGGNIWIVDQNHPSSTSVWLAVRDLLRPAAKHVSEAQRRIILHGDGAIAVKSAVSPNSLVGDVRGLDGVVMNEGAKFDPLVWQKAIRPALSDRKGWSIWPSTPEGLNHFHDLYVAAEDDPDWARWQEPSTANPNFDAKEIESARREGMSDLMIRQEFFAEFVLMGAGRTYYEFERKAHERAFEVDPRQPIDLCVNFGIAPSAWVIAQGDRENGPERVIDEILPTSGDPSVRAFINEFRSRYPEYGRGRNVRVYGENTGKSSGSSDFEQIRAALPDARHYVRSGGFDEKDRTNAVNVMLRDAYGEIRAFVHPQCSRVIRDLEGTRNTVASFSVDHRQPGLGFYAAAWGAKLAYVYPAMHLTLRAQRELGPWGDRPQSTPEAKAAYAAYWTAVRAGRIVRPKACEQCGAVGPVEADHRDYAKPLEVTHLCRRCHRALPPAGGTRQAMAH